MPQDDPRGPAETEHTRVGDQSVRHRREFDAPASAVQRAHTDPERFVRWMGPHGTTVRLDRFDAVTGGAFRYVVEAANGDGWAFRGSYHEVVPGRIVHTWEYEGESGVTLETLRFVDLEGGRSALEITSTHASKEACDAVLASGIDAGMDEDFERIDELLAGQG
ncbi:polyketide cyclase [Curtobacterium sp. MCBD17_013]|uniref:SRPBCC domain-containing protein n=1 Tax=Curtobacterium sp. MCBD17_013 TaxID=2175668 RepID=UPI000DA96FB6|nr:SRPBCC domain-containing protein [Curtobacterium sp. MCBD17_013]PZF66167.1 polyketide cyclase [Curtobacterium sp. MCBD17_013]